MKNESLDFVDEVNSKHGPFIPESISDKLFNSIVKIEINNFIGTGFFIKFQINQKNIYCLLTCEHVISQSNVNKKDSFIIYYGKKNEEKKKNLL